MDLSPEISRILEKTLYFTLFYAGPTVILAVVSLLFVRSRRKKNGRDGSSAGSDDGVA